MIEVRIAEGRLVGWVPGSLSNCRPGDKWCVPFPEAGDGVIRYLAFRVREWREPRSFTEWLALDPEDAPLEELRKLAGWRDA